MSQRRTFDLWLRRCVGISLIVLILTMAVLTWQMSLLVGRVAHTVSRVSGDVQRISDTTAEIADRVNQLNAQVNQWQMQARRVTHADEVKSWINRISHIAHGIAGDNKPAAKDTAQKINYLLSAIADHQGSFRSGSDTDSALSFYLRAEVIYHTFHDSIDSPGDFIRRVSQPTFGGAPYQVLFKDGHHQTVQQWLTDKLRAQHWR